MIQFNLSSPDDENCQFSDHGDSSDEENVNSNLPQDSGTVYSEEESETDEDGHLILKAFLGRWASDCNIPGNAVNILLKGLKSLKNQNDTFAKLPVDVRSLLQTPRSVDYVEHPGGIYFHFGLAKGILCQFTDLPPDEIPYHVKIIINIDGLPLYKSSGCQFWPILCLVKGQQVPFPIGVFHGTVKPKCPNVFLQQFVKEAIHLRNNGLEISGKKVNIRILCFVCDAPAKSFILGIAGHTSKHACPKCKTVGVYYVRPGKRKEE
jgi:hypothetical protein